MSGWLILLLLIAASLGLLRLFGVRGAMLQAAGAALLFGAAGYALQGHPGRAGVPAKGSATADAVSLTGARQAFFGSFTRNQHWLVISEALARNGNSTDSVGILQSAVREHPDDPELWVGLGNALVDHAQVLTPPAELAFQRAAELAPGHPGAPFFYGLALARSGQREAAVEIWRRILAKAPPDAPWRPLVEQGVATLTAPPRAATRQ
jgi:cytochrome c-type biogenesis protein CcmH